MHGALSRGQNCTCRYNTNVVILKYEKATVRQIVRRNTQYTNGHFSLLFREILRKQIALPQENSITNGHH